MNERPTVAPASSNGSHHQSVRGGLLLRLFPRTWRDVYGAEFLALIEDRPPGLRDTLDILVSAFDARVRPSAWIAASRQEPAERERGLVLQSAGGPSPIPEPGATIRVGGPGVDRHAPTAGRRFSRRTFLRNTVMGSVAVAAAGGGASIFAFSRPNKTGAFGGEIVVPRSEIPVVGAAPVKHVSGKSWLINNEDGLIPLYWTCTHLGCTVPWEESEGQFHCPCHHSIYNRFGERVDGPAPRPLDVMAARLGPTGDLVVDTGDIRVRERYEPSQAVRV